MLQLLINLDFDYFFLLWDHTNTEIIDHHQLLHFSMWVGICLYLMILGRYVLIKDCLHLSMYVPMRHHSYQSTVQAE